MMVSGLSVGAEETNSEPPHPPCLHNRGKGVNLKAFTPIMGHCKFKICRGLKQAGRTSRAHLRDGFLEGCFLAQGDSFHSNKAFC